MINEKRLEDFQTNLSFNLVLSRGMKLFASCKFWRNQLNIFLKFGSYYLLITNITMIWMGFTDWCELYLHEKAGLWMMSESTSDGRCKYFVMVSPCEGRMCSRRWCSWTVSGSRCSFLGRTFRRAKNSIRGNPAVNLFQPITSDELSGKKTSSMLNYINHEGFYPE